MEPLVEPFLLEFNARRSEVPPIEVADVQAVLVDDRLVESQTAVCDLHLRRGSHVKVQVRPDRLPAHCSRRRT
jgi:hypothetical protein